MTQKDVSLFIKSLPMPALAVDKDGLCSVFNESAVLAFDCQAPVQIADLFKTHIAIEQQAFVKMQYTEVREGRRKQYQLESVRMGSQTYTLNFSKISSNYVLILVEAEGAQKDLELRLSRSDELIKTLFESADEGMVIVKDGIIQDCNSRIEEMTGYSRFELIDMEFSSCSYDEPETFHEHLAEAERSGFSLFNWDIRHRNGDAVYTQVQATFLELQGNSQILLMITDKSVEYEAVREAEKIQLRYNKIIELMPLPVVMCDLDGYATYMNRSFIKMFGYELEEVAHISIWWEKTVPDVLLRKQIILEWEKALTLAVENGGRSAFPISARFVTKEGDNKIVDVRILMMDGQIIAIISDMTERVEAEEALRESEERLSYSLEATNDGLMDWNLRSNSFYFSHRWFSMLGYIPSQMEYSYEMWLSLVHPDDRKTFEATIELYRNRLDSGYELEYRLRRADGKYSWILARGRAVEWDINGKAVRMIGTHIDITERKAADRELRYLRFFQELLIDSMPSIIIAIDKDFIITEWNLQAEKKYAMLKAEVEGKDLLKLKVLAPELKKCIKDGLAKGGDLSGVRIQDSEGYYSLSMFSLIDTKIKGYVIRLDNIEEQVKLEEMMIHSEKMLSVGGLAAGMAHEINNPLAGIMQCAQVLENRLIKKDLKSNQRVADELGIPIEKIRAYNELRGVPEKIEMILEAGTRAAKIVSDMLTFARKGAIGFSTHNIYEILDRSLLLAGTDYDMKKSYDFKKIEIQRFGDCKEAFIHCDMNQIQQVLLNLFKNSAQAMVGTENPLIRIRCINDADTVHLYIEDNGPGIPNDLRSRIFEPFFTTKEVGVGTGLGLSVSYFIINENHNGTIIAGESEWGGAAFHLSFPSVAK